VTAEPARTEPRPDVAVERARIIERLHRDRDQYSASADCDVCAIGLGETVLHAADSYVVHVRVLDLTDRFRVRWWTARSTRRLLDGLQRIAWHEGTTLR
jgi:hypothetical protein